MMLSTEKNCLLSVEEGEKEAQMLADIALNNSILACLRSQLWEAEGGGFCVCDSKNYIVRLCHGKQTEEYV